MKGIRISFASWLLKSLVVTAILYTSVSSEGIKVQECDATVETNCQNLSQQLNLEDPALVQLTRSTANPKVLSTEYAVRGEVLIRALQLEEELKSNSSAYPFDKIVRCNIGNPQALGQKPVTFIRQVLSLTMNPELLEEDAIMKIYPNDVIDRARKYLSHVKSVGAYSSSNGVQVVRDEVVGFINRRDGVVVKSEDVFLTSGASEAVEMLMRILIRSKNDAVLVPIPQYPLYSALTTAMDGHFAGYHMGDETGWELDMGEVRKALFQARSDGKIVRAMVVINPGNPTGSVLSLENLKSIVSFCLEENIVLLADEVYQRNIYSNESPFISFRRVAHTMGILDSDGTLLQPLQLASFHSISKGVVGECGLRGGFVDLIGFSDLVKDQIYKLASIKLCSNVPGQLAVGLMVNPPREGDISFRKYAEETSNIYDSLRRRAKKLEQVLNRLPGIFCKPIEGALYAFPLVSLPPKFVQEALDSGLNPDTKYAIEVLEKTGLVVVPGNGFGQRQGTYHFRTTFLPPEDTFEEVLGQFSVFHENFMHSWT